MRVPGSIACCTAGSRLAAEASGTRAKRIRPPQLVEPVPGGPITAQAQNSLDTQGTGTQLLVGDIPHRFKPKPQRFVRVSEEGAGGHSEVIAAVSAAVKRRRHGPDFRRSAGGTANPRRPSQAHQIVPAGRFRLKPVAQFDRGSWIFGHARGALPVGLRGIKCIPRFRKAGVREIRCS